MKKSLKNQPEIVSKKRNPSVDIVKGMASIGVVIIHASSYMDDTLPHVYLKAMGRFSVPIFVFFFVYFFSRSLEEGKVLALTQNKIISLAKPYLIWTIFYLFLDFVVAGKSLSSDFGTILDADTWINQGWAGQYFFFVLFESVLLTVLLRLLKTKQLIVITIFAVFLNTAIV